MQEEEQVFRWGYRESMFIFAHLKFELSVGDQKRHEIPSRLDMWVWGQQRRFELEIKIQITSL